MRLTSRTPSDDLAPLAWFAPLSPAARRAAARGADWCSVPAGTRLQRQGLHARWLWVVVDGLVEVHHDGELVGIVAPGRAFGEVELMLGVPSEVEVVAVTDATVVSLSAAAFHGLFTHPCFAAAVAKRLASDCYSARITATASSGPSA